LRVPRLVGSLTEAIANRVAPFPRTWGVYEFLLAVAAGSTEWLRRHQLIVAELEVARVRAGASRLRVVDFGGGRGELRTVLRAYGLGGRHELHLLDIDVEAVDAAELDDVLVSKAIIGPEPPLDYPDRYFDIAVSSDVFEHIPPELRAAWARELARVTRLGQIHTMPADDPSGVWASSVADQDLADWYHARFGIEERWTREHIQNGVPTVAEAREIFDQGELRGFANIGVWTESMHQQFGDSGPLGRIRFGLRYLLQLRSADAYPPFKGCLVIASRDPAELA
jgi:SAM-dependent methyltransferase